MRSSIVARYGIAGGAAALAIMLRLALDPIWGIRLPFITLFPAIMVSAWVGGVGPGLLTTAITGLAAVYYWIAPARSWAVTEPSELLGVLVFVAVGCVISVLNEAWRRGTVAIAESEQRLSVTLSSIGDAVIATDRQGHVVRLNAVAEALTGWTEHHAVGQRLEEIFIIFNEETRQPTESPVGRVLRDNVIVGLANHTVLISKDGREISIDDSAAPIRTADGVVTGVILVFRDITARRQAEREREIALERERAARAAVERAAVGLHESEERLRITIASIGDAVLATDEKGYITQLNPVGEALTGWRQTEALGRPLDEVLVILNETSRQPAPNPVERVLREGVVAGLANHTVLISKTGREIPIDDSAAPLRAADGRLVGAVMVFRDTTERREAERERAARARVSRELAAIVESSDDAILSTDLDGTITAWNQAAEQMYGYAASEATGQSIRLIVSVDRWHEEDEILERIRRGGRIEHVETLRRRKDGAEFAVSITASPVLDDTGAVVGMSKIARDITARKRIEDERTQVLLREQAAREDLERASRLKDEFLAVLSHELRTPLNAVLGYAHLLNSGALPPERARHALDAIQRNAHAQARLVESLLDLSRIMAGKLELNLEELNLATVVTAAVDALAPGAEEKGMAIDVVVPPIPIVADGGRLQQVFWNLLSNAIKFGDRGGRVAVRCTEQDGHVRVQVTDNGEGIGAEFLPFVFDRFRQADGPIRGSRTGLGLGLALVREMVQAHGGTVVAESPGEGRGSTFSVTLPLSISAFAPGPTKTSALPADAPESLPLIEILIVDDDGDGRALLALLLESRGASVRTVSSASEALDAISQRRPDLLLADLRMPDEDGYALIRKVRAREREQQERRLPAIAVTAYASQSDRDQAIAAGFDSHVAKPVEPDVLARAVAKVARGRSPRNETV